MPDLSRVGEREGLKPRREPYWQRLRPGCFVGYRPSRRGGAGTWIARAYEEERTGYRLQKLGSFGDRPAGERFTMAKRAAEEFAAKVERGGVADEKIETVEDACRRFGKGNDDADARFRRYVYSDPIAKVQLAKLRRSHVAAWRERLRATPALVSRRKEGEPITRLRSPATLNRDMAVLRAALGKVHAVGAPHTDAAWQEELKPIRNAVKPRTLYLDRAQRRALVDAADAEAKPFVRALCALPLRPGALAALTAADFDKRTSELTVPKDKAGSGRRFFVPKDQAALLIAAAKDKLPAAPLFTRANASPWTKETWNDAIRAAAEAAKLPSGVTAYTLRHSTITDLVSSGAPLLWIARICGTSAAMIEKHYGHLVADAATKALAALTL